MMSALETVIRSRGLRVSRVRVQIDTCFRSRPKPYSTTSTRFDHDVDVLIVGSGATGMTAALRAHHHGLKPLIVEKSPKRGGATAWSGGGLWVPDNHLHRAAGIQDSRTEALRYLDHVIKETGPYTSKERRVAYVETASKMVSFLEEQGFRWYATLGYEEYYPDAPGSLAGGRSIEGNVFDLNRLGPLQEHLNVPSGPLVPMFCNEAGLALTFMTSAKGRWTLARVLGRAAKAMLMRQKAATVGVSLAGQLLHLNQQAETEIWRETPFSELIIENGRVLGAVVKRDGTEVTIRARGVLLAAGGFAKNKAMRERYQTGPTNIEWSSVPSYDTGDTVKAGIKAGAAVALMDDAWWGPTLLEPAMDRPAFIIWDRARPHSIMVDSAGRRFTNEAESYVDAVHNQFERHKKTPAIPAWLVVDSQYRKKYTLGMLMPRQKASKVYDGYLIEASTIPELATKIGVDTLGLESTIGRFNEMARDGLDEDYGRGRNAYDRFFGDPAHTPNPNLGTIEEGPFYAVQVWPGDLGTKGGLVPNEHAQVVREDGSIIAGLYAAGNTSASMMGRTYPGAGSTLGPAMTFGYRAADHMAGMQ